MASNPNNTQPPEAVEEPSELDILVGRSEYCYNHVGNQAFRTIIDDNLGWYSSVMKGRKVNKIAVVTSIMNTITHGGGWFLRQSPHDLLWYKLDYKNAREKVAHALRNRLKQMTSRASLVLQATKHEDYDWSSQVRRAAKFKEERKGISQESEGIDDSTDKHSVAKVERDRLEASFGESHKWFRPFVYDTLQDSIVSVSGPIDNDPRGYMGSACITALPSLTMHGSRNDSFEPLPIQPVHPLRNKTHHGHCSYSIGSNDGGSKEQFIPTETPMPAPKDDISPAPIMSAPRNVVTPPQGPQPLSHQLLAKQVVLYKLLLAPAAKGSAANVADETFAGESSKVNDNPAINHKKSSAKPDDFVTTPLGSCPPSGELVSQCVPNDFLLPRQVSLEQESTDNNVTETSAGGFNKRNDHSPNDDEVFVDLEKLIQDTDNPDGAWKYESSPSFMDSSCEESTVCSCCLETHEDHDDVFVDLDSLVMDLDDTEHMQHSSSSRKTTWEPQESFDDLFQGE